MGGGAWVGCVAGIIEATGGVVDGCCDKGLDWAWTSAAAEMQVTAASRIGRELSICR